MAKKKREKIKRTQKNRIKSFSNGKQFNFSTKMITTQLILKKATLRCAHTDGTMAFYCTCMFFIDHLHQIYLLRIWLLSILIFSLFILFIFLFFCFFAYVKMWTENLRSAYLDIIILVDARNEVAPINYSDFLYDIQHSQSVFFLHSIRGNNSMDFRLFRHRWTMELNGFYEVVVDLSAE